MTARLIEDTTKSILLIEGELPRGKVLGGSSAINCAVALRARPENFKKCNLPGWSYADMLPYYKKLETTDSESSELRGFKEPIPIRLLLRSDLTSAQRAFVDSTSCDNLNRMFVVLSLGKYVHQ